MTTGGPLTPRQRKRAKQIANLDEEVFDKEVESDNPPGTTKLAAQGASNSPLAKKRKKKREKPLIDLEGRDPKDFQMATRERRRK